VDIAHYISSLEGVDTLGTVWLIVGLAGFVAVLVRTVRLKRSYIGTMEQLPLETDAPMSDHHRKA
jgi:hypothetical protein